MAIIYKFSKKKQDSTSPASPAKPVPAYNRVRYWLENYAHPELPDAMGIEDFVENEPIEHVRSFQNELHNIVNGNYNEEHLTQILKAGRKVKHGSYSNWARLMLLKSSRVNC